MKKDITLHLNDEIHELTVDTRRTLLEVLRNDLGLTGAKEGCGLGECGACTVLLDGEAVNACLVLAVDAEKAEITTIEGLSQDRTLDPIQKAFIEHGAIQCGFCTPGMILSAKALLDRDDRPTQEEIKTALSGVLCRCTGYQQIIEAVAAAAEKTGTARPKGRRSES
ncbi:MAG: (2Fe-2S)-binding protein [Thermodesulfobacteriota bacterium]